jgi:outer membrane protein assembly factor BamB
LAFLGGLLAFGSGCSGHLIHRDLSPDENVMSRGWTLSTRSSVDGGSRPVEFSNPVFYENTLIFGNQTTGLTSIYPGLLLKRWQLPIEGGVISEITVDKDNAYFGGGDGFLYSVDAETGRVKWKYDLRNPIISRPTLAGGRVFVTTTDDTVYAFDAGDGSWIWHYRRRTSPSSTILGASAPLVDGKEVLAGLSDGFLVALNVEDGQLKWERKLHQGSKFTDVDAHPVLEAGVLYVPSYDGALYALKRETGDIIWRFDAGGCKQVIIDGERLYLPSSDGHIYALRKSNAQVLWKFALDSGVPTRLVLTDHRIIFGSSYQYLYALDKETGRGLYRLNVGYGSGFYGSPAFNPEKKMLYILSARGNLYSFDVGGRGFRRGK